MPRKFLLVLVFSGLLLGVYLIYKLDPSPTQNLSPTPTPDLTSIIVNDISQEFAKKYDKEALNIDVTVDSSNENFAKGQIRFLDEFGGAIWFGVKEKDRWILASDGQGPITCEVAEKYSFPSEFVPECIDGKGELEERQEQ